MHTWFLNSTWSFREPFPGSDNFSVNPFGAGPSSVKVSVVGVGRKPDVNKNGETELKNNIQGTFLQGHAILKFVQRQHTFSPNLALIFSAFAHRWRG